MRWLEVVRKEEDGGWWYFTPQQWLPPILPPTRDLVEEQFTALTSPHTYQADKNQQISTESSHLKCEKIILQLHIFFKNFHIL